MQLAGLLCQAGCLYTFKTAVCFQFTKNVWHKSLLPSLLISASQSLVQLSTAAIVPVVANQVITYRRHEGAFSMSVMGFGWLCVCICTPCFLLPVVKRQRGVIFSAAFLLSSIGFSRKNLILNYFSQ
jgi:hypothetical protein